MWIVNCVDRGDNSLGARKIRIETILEDGNKLTFSIDGPLNRDKIVKYLDLLELMGASDSISYPNKEMINDFTVLDRLLYIIKNNLSNKWFPVKDTELAYEKEFGETIKKSTLATYLNRLVNQHVIIRAGRRGSYRYSLNYFRGERKPKINVKI